MELNYNKGMKNEKNITDISVTGFILKMVLRIGVGLLLILGLMLGLGFGLDRWLDTSPMLLIVFIVLSAPIAMALIFFYVRNQTKHLKQQNIVENPDILTKKDQ